MFQCHWTIFLKHIISSYDSTILLKNYTCLEQHHLFIQLAGSFSVNQNICALLVGRLLSSSLSVFNVSSPVLSYTKGFDLTIIIRPLIPTKGGTGRKITWEGNYWFWCLRSVIHMLVIVMTKLEPIFSTCSLISSSKHAHP